MKKIGLCCLAALILCIGLPARIQESSVVERLLPQLRKIVELSRTFRKIHPFLKTLDPIAVVEGENFYLFDIDPGGGKYNFVKDVPVSSPIPDGVRAALPLSFYDDRMACVITPEALGHPEGQAAIFHEFIHCRQWEHGEREIKKTLGVARRAEMRKDVMWEIDHPFPYQDELFIEIYALFLEASSRGDEGTVQRCRMNLREILNNEDFEYMIWQEWKEGFARRIENKIREQLGLDRNRGGAERPFDRVSFYAGGSALISRLIKADPELETDLVALFTQMKNLSF